uniref:Carboxy-cis,cis-muconate cyclase n=1 Tax=Cutibacterium granulosum DSM 20700 TaxID=1160719 RepID=A0A9X5LTB2_9ACTN
MAVAHYESGEVSMVQVDQWGADPQIIARTHVEGNGPVAGRQDSAHPHHILWLDRTHFAVTDLGADAVRFLRLSGLGLEQIGELAAPAGLGPCHALLTRDRSKQILTVSGELSASVQSWSRRASEDAWSRGWRLVDQTPSSSDATAMPSAIVPGPESQLLVANRGVGTCGVLSGPLGHHKLIDEFPLGGVQPRDVTSDGDQLWVAEQADGAVLCLHRSSEGWRQRLRLDLPGASRVLIGPTLG